MNFTDLRLIEKIQQTIQGEGYKTPTPIQQQAIPAALSGKDILGIAQTGTGKTAAFSLPILQKLAQDSSKPRPNSPRSLILAPTRELANQIEESIKTYGRGLHLKSTVVYGGVGQGPQVQALKRGVDILVATPGRLMDLQNQGHIKLNQVEVFVLDEADRMLDMGFIPDIRKIVKQLPNNRQSMFFSATMSSQIGKLASTLLRDPVRVEVAPQATTINNIEQRVLFVDQENKDKLLLDLLEKEHLTKVLVFTRTKHRANRVAQKLSQKKIRSSPIHGNKTQSARAQALDRFKDGKIRVLVATDVAARGIDVEDISHVIQYELPDDAESYVHRIGRTARAGAKGTAYAFCAADEKDKLVRIEKLIGSRIEVLEHPHHSKEAKNAKPIPAKRRGGGKPKGQFWGRKAKRGRRR